MTIALLILLAAALGIAMLALSTRRLLGTTLLAPLAWSTFSVASIAAAELAIALCEHVPSWSASARFAAAITTMAPALALLGAKRPQVGPWQFIVVTLLVVLAMPSLQWWLLDVGQLQEIHPSRLLLLAVLGGLGLVNYLPTCYWLSAVCVTAAQAAALAPHLFRQPAKLPPGAWPLVALILIDLALLLAFLVRRADRIAFGPVDRAWIDFRNAYGLLWAVRVANRVNATAVLQRSCLRLAWSGLVHSDYPSMVAHTAKAVEEQAISRTLRSLLRRFVSRQWLPAAESAGTQPEFGSAVATSVHTAQNDPAEAPPPQFKAS